MNVDIEFIENDLKTMLRRIQDYRNLSYIDFCPDFEDPEQDAPDGIEDFMDAIYTVEEGLNQSLDSIRTIREGEEYA